MKYILIPLAVIIYTIIVYKATVYYHYYIKEHIIYGKIIPYEFMNDGDLARLKLHYNGDNIIDSVTMSNARPTLEIYHPNIGSMHVDFMTMQIMLRDRGEWMQFKTYEEMNGYMMSRFPIDEFDH